MWSDGRSEARRWIISPLIFLSDVIHKPPREKPFWPSEHDGNGLCFAWSPPKRAVMARSPLATCVIEAEHAIINQAKRTPKEPNTR